MSQQSCCIVGAGPAGLMLGLLLARAGVAVTVIEKHDDFLQDFRGDTIHPSTLEVMAELGLLDELLSLPHQKASALYAEIDDRAAKIADFSRLPTRCKFIAFMPQRDFLCFLVRKAAAYSGFRLLMGCQVTGLVQQGGVIEGVRVIEKGSEKTIRASLTVGADGRESIVRREAGLKVEDLGSNVDVLWMRISRRQDDAAVPMGHAGPSQGLVMIDRGDYWQIGFVIGKGSFDDVKGDGLPALRRRLASFAPFAGERFEEIADWSDVHLLRVRMDRAGQWWKPGLLCIGDAAHAMSPIGGVGVNLAIQDAIAAANTLAGPLRDGTFSSRHLATVQKRRAFPTKATQRVQMMMRRKRSPTTDTSQPKRPPAFLRLIARSRLLPHLTGRLIGIGFRPEHIRN